MITIETYIATLQHDKGRNKTSNKFYKWKTRSHTTDNGNRKLPNESHHRTTDEAQKNSKINTSNQKINNYVTRNPIRKSFHPER